MPYKNYYIFTENCSKEKCEVTEVKQRNRFFYKDGWPVFKTSFLSIWDKMLIIISNSSKIIHRIILIKLKFNLINFFEFCDFNWLHSCMCSDEHILINKLTEIYVLSIFMSISSLSMFMSICSLRMFISIFNKKCCIKKMLRVACCLLIWVCLWVYSVSLMHVT